MIKIETSNIGTDLYLTIDKSDGVLVIDHQGIITLFHLSMPTTDEIETLLFPQSYESIKYIGNQDLLDRILHRKGNIKFDKKVITTDSIDMVFHKTSKRVRISKEHTIQSRKKYKVLIIDDSSTIQKLLSRIIEDSSSYEVMATASCPSEATKIIETQTPDIITLDIHMPEMNGVDYLKSYLANKNIPTLMITSINVNEGPLVMEALANGAISYMQKPSLENPEKVKTEVLNNLDLVIHSKSFQRKTKLRNAKAIFNNTEGIITIGSSTGGTKALEDIFTSFEAPIPPIIVIQHIPAKFSLALAQRLDKLCPFTVKEAEHNDQIQPNTVYIAPGDYHLSITKQKSLMVLKLDQSEPINCFRPSIDYFFQSLTKIKNQKILASVLTGMGKDGAQGLLALKESGASTFAQDKDSSIVYGMPREAFEIGAATDQVSLQDIPNYISNHFNKNFKNKKAS